MSKSTPDTFTLPLRMLTLSTLKSDPLRNSSAGKAKNNQAVALNPI
jgi:hypothetical protein